MDPDRSLAPAVLFLDVGQGDASVVILPGVPRRAIVVDCNDAYVVDRHLTDFKVEKLDAVVFTHLDLDHIRGGLELVRKWGAQTARVYVDTDGRRLDDASENQRAIELLDELIEMRAVGDQPGPLLMAPQKGIDLAAGEGWHVRLVAPDHAHQLAEVKGAPKRTTNEHSAVVRIERDFPGGRRSLLIGGDAPLRVWEEMASADRKAEVFRVPHHGGALTDGGVPSGWTPATLYEKVGPIEAVISVGSTNDHGHPAPAWREPLVGRPGCRVRCTQVTAACHPAASDRDESHRRRSLALAMRGHAEPAWRHMTKVGERVKRDAAFHEVPCAGTVSVGLESSGNVVVRPTAADHDAILKLWAHPWCKPPPPPPSSEEHEVDPLAEVLGELLS